MAAAIAGLAAAGAALAAGLPGPGGGDSPWPNASRLAADAGATAAALGTAAGGMAAVAWQAVQAHLPPAPTRPLLALPPPAASPLAIESARARRLPEGQGFVWDVRAVVRNPTAVPAPVPAVEMLLLGADGETLMRRRIVPPAAQLAAGAAMELTAGAFDPESRVAAVRLRLSAAGPGRP